MIKKHSLSLFALVIISTILSNLSAQAQVSTGENMVRLTTSTLSDFNPTWDPRGVTIAYLKQKTGSSRFDEYKVESSNQAGEQPLITGLNQDFGLAINSSWIGKTGFLAIEEAISGFEYLKFDTAQAPFDRTTANGNDAATTTLLNIDSFGGGGLMKVSRDGSTALIRFSSSGSGGNVSLRVGPVSSMNAQAASTFGTAVISASVNTDPRYYNGGALSPDGSNVVVSVPLATSDTAHDLKYGPIGRTLTNITNTTSDITNVFPDISPDGTKIIFSRGPNGNGHAYDLYVINVDGTGLTQITNTPNFSETYATWSPDGTAVAFTGTHSTGHESEAPALPAGETANANIYLLALPATVTEKIVTPKTVLTEPPIVSVSGKNVTFTFEAFLKADKKAAAAFAALQAKLAALEARAKKKPKAKYTFDYELQVAKDGAKKKDIVSKTSKKNSITLKNLKPGSYNSKYRVEIFKKEGSKTTLQGRTKFSPTAKFTVS